MTFRERLARFLHDEARWARREGKSWEDEPLPVKYQWYDEADRYQAHLREKDLEVKEHTHGVG